jgi:hypothetical protein
MLLLAGCTNPATEGGKAPSTANIVDNSGTPQWALSTTATMVSQFAAVATGSDGSLYTAGTVATYGSYDFGNGVKLTASTSNSLLLVKYNASGVAQWAQSLASSPNVSLFNGVAVDSSGNVYAVGYIKGTSLFTLGNGVTVQGASNNSNAVIIKYSSSGTVLWARSVATGAAENIFYGVAVDSEGNAYAAGFITAGVTYQYGTGVTAKGNNSATRCVVLVKYDSAGTALWAKTTSTGMSGQLYSVAVDNSGNVYAGGTIEGNDAYNFGNNVILDLDYSGSYGLVVKYDANGLAQWVRTATRNPDSSNFQAVKPDPAGNVYAAGYTMGSGTFDFGDGVTVAGTSTNYNVLLVKYSSAGVAQWAQTTTSGSSSSDFYALTVDGLGNAYAVGYVVGTEVHGFGAVTGSGAATGSNFLLVKYGPSGTAQWVRSTTSGQAWTDGTGVAAQASGGIVAVGHLGDSVSVGLGNNVTVTGTVTGRNPILVKYQ